MLAQIQKFQFALLAILVTFLASPSPMFAFWYPEQQFVTGAEDFNGIDLASDAHGNGIVIYLDAYVNQTGVYSSYYNGSTGTWGAPQFLDTDPVDFEGPVIAMNSSGTALGAWVEASTGNIVASQFTNGNWSTPIIIGNTTTESGVETLSIAINNQGQGVLIYCNTADDAIFAVFFNGTQWGSSTQIGNGFDNTDVAYSDSGSIVAGWIDSSHNFITNIYASGSWQGPVTLGAVPNGIQNASAVGIDARGNALAVWEDRTTMYVFANYYTQGMWQPTPTIISTTPAASANSLSVSLSMAPNGAAIAAWVDNSDNYYSSSFDRNTWMAPLLISTSTSATDGLVSVSINDYGNAFAVWLDNTFQAYFSAELPFGGVWNDYESVGGPSGTDPSGYGNGNLYTSYSNNGPYGTRFAAWEFPVPEFDLTAYNAAGAASPSTPSELNARICKNKFAMQTERVKIITWAGAADSGVVSYLLTRNGKLIATIPATGPFVYNDHGRCKETDVYTLTALYNTGFESTPLEISVK